MFAWLRKLDAHFPLRYAAWLACGIGFLLTAFVWVGFGIAGWFALGFFALVLVGVRDTRQNRHAILRNDPVIGHLRSRKGCCWSTTRWSA